MKLPAINRSNLKNTATVVAILLIAILIFAYMKSTKPKQPPIVAQQKVWPVKVVSADIRTVYPRQTLYGTVESSQLVTASSPVSGVVGDVWVKAGDAIHQGQKLVALSEADIELPYQVAKADVADTKAQLELQNLSFKSNTLKLESERKMLKIKQDDVHRNEQLIRKGLSSQSVLDASKEALLKQKLSVVNADLTVQENQLKVSQLEARLAKAKANFRQAEINRKRGVVVAPYDGRIAKVSVSKGDRVNVNSALVTYYALSSLELKAKIPVTEIRSVYDAMSEGIQLYAEYAGHLGKTVEFPLKRLGGEASASGLDAYFEIPSSLSLIRPGDLLKVNLKRQGIEGGFAVPYSALYGSDRVYVVLNGELAMRKVSVLGETKIDQDTWVLLKGDVKSGEKVLITHLPNAISGLKVATD